MTRHPQPSRDRELRLQRLSAARMFSVGQTVGQPTCTVADISDGTHAPDTPLARIARQRFCPDTEEVTGSNPVSPTNIWPSQRHIPENPPGSAQQMRNRARVKPDRWALWKPHRSSPPGGRSSETGPRRKASSALPTSSLSSCWLPVGSTEAATNQCRAASTRRFTRRRDPALAAQTDCLPTNPEGDSGHHGRTRGIVGDSTNRVGAAAGAGTVNRGFRALAQVDGHCDAPPVGFISLGAK